MNYIDTYEGEKKSMERYGIGTCYFINGEKFIG